MTVGNGGREPVRAVFTAYYDQGKQSYELEQMLAPDEQMWVDVGKLVHEQVPDKDGKVLPRDLASGTYEFRDATHLGVGTLFEGKVAFDKTHGHVAYGCTICCGTRSAFLWSDPLGIPFTSTAPNGVNEQDSCTLQIFDGSGDFTGGWTTGSAAVATVDTYGVHTGVSVGSTTSTASGEVQNGNWRQQCPLVVMSPSGTANVGPPHHLKVLSDTYSPDSACPTTARRLIKYQEVDVNNNAVGTIQSKEQFASKSANTCNNGNFNTSETCSTDPNGIFTDQLSIGCNSVGGSCGPTLTKQQWLWCPPGGAAAVVIAAPGDLIIHNDSISVGGNTAGFSAGTYICASGAVSTTGCP